MKTAKKMQAVTVDYNCDECQIGKMRFDGIVLTSNPPQYPHQCNKCGHAQTFFEHYPHIEYVEKE